jgi:broad specificity phosphatase PhoE
LLLFQIFRLNSYYFLNKAGEGKTAQNEFKICKGRWPKGETRSWETIDMMSERIMNTLKKYLAYKKIVVVSHGMLMHQLKAYPPGIPNCFIDEIEFTENFISPGWVDIEK